MWKLVIIVNLRNPTSSPLPVLSSRLLVMDPLDSSPVSVRAVTVVRYTLSHAMILVPNRISPPSWVTRLV